MSIPSPTAKEILNINFSSGIAHNLNDIPSFGMVQIVIKLQSTALTQLTQITNQLTRTSSIIASDKCHNLSRTLNSTAIRTTYEDIQISATQIAQCSAYVLTAINDPLQQRTIILNSHLSYIDIFFDEYESEDQNFCYQKEIANKIKSQTMETISLLTSALNIRLIIDQNFTSIMEPLVPFGNSESKSNTNFSTIISFSILDQDRNEIPTQTDYNNNNNNHRIE
ncbi:unnamed protein product [Rotaria sp. Silwood1]|nr:unnamed protein product [Rotaria sp. Silwood1]CAF4879300.1 unnamed protein product [Rotaria sp. Silwood1]